MEVNGKCLFTTALHKIIMIVMINPNDHVPYFIPGYPEFSEAKYFVPQAGVWEVRRTSDPSHGQVNRQVVLHRPVAWCQQASPPLNLAGNYNWSVN